MLTNIKSVNCPDCAAFAGDRCQRNKREWKWCAGRIVAIQEEQRFLDRYDYTDDYFDPCCPDCGCYPCRCDFEALEAEQDRKVKAHLQSLSPELLAREWWRECSRHDGAVDRCEEINSPTIEDAAGWMRWIEGEYERRGLNHHDYVRSEIEDAALAADKAERDAAFKRALMNSGMGV